ncbi:hypothetical protein RYH80_07100 [Halobaculum sp. MBLA0147]|uniref:hypothetical protein n=1 Tax=Halobaculum sp. MBLA0147 TaxID=3079934 RepID=UPI003525BD1D
MADLLTHVLVPYVVLTVGGWYWSVPRRWVPVAMGGAAIPDLMKLDLVLDEVVIQSMLGVPFEYDPIASVAGVAVIAGGFTVWFERSVWQEVYALLVFGGCTSLVLDGLRVFVDGASGFWLYPVWIRPLTPNLYVSSDPRVTAIIGIVVGVVWLLDTRYVE